MMSSPLLVSLGGLLLCAFQTGAPSGLVAKEEAAFKAVAAAVAPSVVRIETLGGVDTADGRLLGAGPATGTIVRADGLILTSSEAFVGDPTSILVRLPDGRRLAAERLGEDEARQLTLIRIEPPEGGDPLVPAVPAEIADLQVGDWAVAVGRTFSAESVNVSVGVVSAKDRILGRAVQTDAKISPANYGGPLVDLAGRTIGILAPLSADGGAGGVEWYDSGIGFAVPLADLQPVLDRLADGETLRPGKLGITFKGANLDAEPIIDSVRPLSPAEEAGLKPGDRLVTVAGRDVTRPDEAKLALGPLYAGDEASMTVTRDGKDLELKATLVAELPAWRPGDLGVLPADPVESDDAGVETAEAGVRIAHVFPGSAADGTLEVGDVITAAAGEAVATADDLRRIISRRLPGTEVPLQRAEGEPVTVTLREPPTAPPQELPNSVDPASDPLPEDRSGQLPLEVAGFDGREGTLLVPERSGRGGYALLVCPPPKGMLAHEEILDLLGPFAERHGVILLVPRPELVIGFQPGDLPFVAAAVEQTREQYAVDPARTALFGFGNEGRTVWQIARAAAAGLYRGVVTDTIPARLPPNDPDRAILPLLLRTPSAKIRDALIESGYPVAVLETEMSGDELVDEATDAVMRWVTALDRI